MKLISSEKDTTALETPANNRQVHMIVDGRKIKLNFPVESKSSAISDIKHMMLGGAVKT